MSECICGNCPSTFKFASSEEEEYLCLIDGDILRLEHAICLEELGKMGVFNMVNIGKKLTDEQQKFLDFNTNYWSEREKITTIELNRRKGMG